MARCCNYSMEWTPDPDQPGGQWCEVSVPYEEYGPGYRIALRTFVADTCSDRDRQRAVVHLIHAVSEAVTRCVAGRFVEQVPPRAVPPCAVA